MNENIESEAKGGIEEKPNPVSVMSSALLLLADYMKELSAYHTVRDADMDSLKDLITRAKGPSRSMRQFAEAVGVSPATMSRIMNHKTPGPLNKELLAKVAANADPQSGITLDMLLKANGEAKKGFSTSEKLREDEIRKTLLDELIKRGYVVVSTIEESATIRRGPGYTMRFDFEIETDAVGTGNGKNGKWLFEFKSSMSSEIDEHHHPAGSGRYRQWLTMVMSMYYCGMADADRISYVTDHRAMFEQAKTVFSGVRIPNEISILLISGGRVVEEFIVPTTGDQPREVFYELIEGEESKDVTESEEMDWDMDAFSGGSTTDDSAE